MKVLYIYSGKRTDRFNGRIGIDYPDTQFYGLNHLSKFGIEAEYKEADDFIKSSILRRILSWRARHFMMFFLARKYDVVFGISIIYMMFWRKIIPARNTKFVLYNSVIRRTLIANKNKPLKLLIIKWLLKELDGVVCLSNFQKEYMEKNLPFLKEKVFFVPLGVVSDYYKFQRDERKQFYLSVGRDNGRDYKAVIDVARDMPDREFHIVCLPRNVKGIKNIPINVKIMHNISPEALSREYKEAHAMLLITHDDNHLEGSADASGPTVLVEAMAVGLPVIASRKKYLEDYVNDGEEAMLVDFHSKDDIINKIKKMDDSIVAEKMANSARKKVEEDLSTEMMAKSLSEIFNKFHESN